MKAEKGKKEKRTKVMMMLTKKPGRLVDPKGLNPPGRKFMVAVVIVISLQPTCYAAPSSYGKIHSISYPFRLKGKYYAEAINYINFTIRLVDPGVLDHQQPISCSTIPRYFLNFTNFSYGDPYAYGPYPFLLKTYGLSIPIIYLNCDDPVIDDSRYVYVDTADCVDGGYNYAVIVSLQGKDLKVGCHMKSVALTSLRWLFAKLDMNVYSSFWREDENIKIKININVSYTDISFALVYGFEVSWLDYLCQFYCGRESLCRFNYYRGELQNYGDNCYHNYVSRRSNCCMVWSEAIDYLLHTHIKIVVLKELF
ncbi:Receptor-like protein kinase [Quillaja saponaria]|uniref:Receptor-like protein kinase n=1 Tax=Quillaja saponaria TaxID=32244 RepID=A0AAD7PKS5_QUISA|nr:Receptor-like protein kinase [Quillaja saponaria]